MISISRIGTKLILSMGLFLIVLAIAISVPVLRGFKQTQQDAVDRSSAGLAEQGQEALVSLVAREAQVTASQLQPAVALGRQAANFFVNAVKADTETSWTPLSRLARSENDRYIDRNTNGSTYLIVFDTTSVPTTTTDRDIRQSAVLDLLFPALATQFPDGDAIYFINPQGLTRYYPPRELDSVIPPGFTPLTEPFYALAAPEANPERKTTWTAPYIDPANQGAMVTASTPIYEGDTFRGVIGVDVTLTNLIDRLLTIKPTPGSYAFLLDREGRLVAAPPEAIGQLTEGHFEGAVTVTETLGIALTDVENPEFSKLIQHMRAGNSGVGQLELGGKPALLAYAPLSLAGWSLGVIVPPKELTERSAQVAAAIRRGTDNTLRSTATTLAIAFVLALVGTLAVSRRLTQPITALVAGTRAIAAGDLSVRIPLQSRDELGQMAEAFNHMATELSQAQKHLAEANLHLEATVRQRTAELENERARLQETLATLQQSLDERRALAQTLAAVSMPAIPVLKGVLVLPIIGVLDEQRGAHLQTSLLDGIARHRAGTVIIDSTGISGIDDRGAALLVQAAASARLLGARTIIVGITPEVAEVLVQMNISTTGIITMQDLQAAVQYALEIR